MTICGSCGSTNIRNGHIAFGKYGNTVVFHNFCMDRVIMTIVDAETILTDFSEEQW